MKILIKWFKKSESALNEIQIDMWYHKLQHMPEPAFSAIVDRVTNSEKFMPAPDLILQLYSQWKSDHPALIAREYEEQWCDECEGWGAIPCWYIPEDIKGYFVGDKRYIYYARKDLPCSECDNWKRQFPTQGERRPNRFWRKQEILSRGWLLKSPDKEIMPFRR